ncbi:coenzyme F420-0:L-glutamate ligase [Clostridiaceae bacterium HSG29]|nr:coenzyme F420-0:L-glutamate ligase [Clostridiaceae bacterium HSG29]
MIINVENKEYDRIPIKTHLIDKTDEILDVVEKYAVNEIQEGDILFISEKAVAVTQSRSFFVTEIKPSKMATFISSFVTRSPYGIGLGMPETMEMAIRECGLPKILLASVVGGFTKKVLGRSGDFYRIAGPKARAIDGPTSGTIPPLNKCVVLGPEDPDKVAKSIEDKFNLQCLIIDANDLGQDILGFSNKSLKDNVHFYEKLISDNPLGQGHQQTPMGLIRKIN